MRGTSRLLPLSPALLLSFSLLLFMLALLPIPAYGQRTLSDDAQISLITILPGDQVYSVFGHSALRVYDPVIDYDVSYNYGTFDFGNPLVFAGRFAYGKLDYFLSTNDFPRAARYYWEVEGRPLIEQVLNLTPSQRQTLFEFLETNALPENRTYRYDFFFDNCSTRIRDVLEQVLGDAIQFAPEPDPRLSFRHLIDPYLVEKPIVHFGMDLGLGIPADRIATPREVMFLPDYLMAAFDQATVRLDSTTVPLVARTDTVVWSAEQAMLEPAWSWPSLLLWILLALGLVLTFQDLRARTISHRLFDGLLFGTVGVAGLLIVFLWFISLHAVTHGNFNLIWAWPTHLIAAGALLRRSQATWLRMYLAAVGMGTLLFTLGWPFWPQEVPAAILPLLLLLLVRCAIRLFVGKKDGVPGAKSTPGMR